MKNWTTIGAGRSGLAAGLLLAAACGGPAREVQKAPPPAVHPEPAPALLPADDGVTLEYRPHAEGRTMMEVASPEGAQVQVFDGAAQVTSETAPLSFNATPDHYYRITAHLPSGALREKKVQAQAGQVATLHFRDTGKTGPVPMTAQELKRLEHAIDLEAGDKAKLSVLETAAAHAWFTTAQAGALLEHVVYRQSKLDAVPVIKDRILDKQNAYLLYQHFTYREDKEKVREMLEK